MASYCHCCEGGRYLIYPEQHRLLSSHLENSHTYQPPSTPIEDEWERVWVSPVFEAWVGPNPIPGDRWVLERPRHRHDFKKQPDRCDCGEVR